MPGTVLDPSLLQERKNKRKDLLTICQALFLYLKGSLIEEERDLLPTCSHNSQCWARPKPEAYRQLHPALPCGS